jgi:hypothetical protein
MPQPNFLVIGAGRSGTTSLHHYLHAHPDIFLPEVKSPSYFYCRDLPPDPDPRIRHVTANYFVPDPAAYRALFDNVRHETAIGEVSPAYLATVHAAPRIAAELPNVRLVAIFRHPVDRAFARYVGRLRDGLEARTSFADVVADERRHPLVRNISAGTYLAAGAVSHVLRTYLDHFPRERLRAYLFEDLVADPAGVVRDLYAFLGVDDSFVPDTGRRHNASGGTIANPLLRAAWTGTALLRARARRYVPIALRDRAFGLVTRDLAPVTFDPGLRAELTTLYRDDITALAALIGRDLSNWLDHARGSTGAGWPA